MSYLPREAIVQPREMNNPLRYAIVQLREMNNPLRYVIVQSREVVLQSRDVEVAPSECVVRTECVPCPKLFSTKRIGYVVAIGGGSKAVSRIDLISSPLEQCRSGDKKAFWSLWGFGQSDPPEASCHENNRVAFNARSEN